MEKIILGIVGEIASGKTTITEHIKDTYGAVTFRFSDVLRDILKRIHQPETRENMQMLSTALRTGMSEDLLSKVLAEDVTHSDAPIIITEGIRRPSDIEYLKDLPGFVLIAIKVDEKTRYERLTERSENPDDRTKTWEAFLKEAQAEPEQKIKEIAQQANYTLDNNGSSEDLYAQIDAIMNELKAK